MSNPLHDKAVDWMAGHSVEKQALLAIRLAHWAFEAGIRHGCNARHQHDLAGCGLTFSPIPDRYEEVEKICLEMMRLLG